ncbi:MAG TPA: DUF2334 domain-containing protein, partial [Tepidisphaeraceae bacterium]|nr:DUF2334 domain-containing protein [Tepidisphaeraceae bacterium]
MAVLFSLAILLLAPPTPAQPVAPRPDPWLILYDSNGTYGWIGELHATLLGNLLGHFPVPFQIKPVETYRARDLNDAAGLFYLGTIFNNPLSASFLSDVMVTDKPVCWFKYNLPQLAHSPAYTNQFLTRFGFHFDFIDASGFATIRYKSETFSKDLIDPDVGRTAIINPVIASAPAVAFRADSNSIPYILHAANLWYIADSPFSYMSEEDRYLVFADLLHDIVQINHPESHRAIIRLEDISPVYPSALLHRAADLLAGEAVPFAAAVVPIYKDPLGYYTGGVPEEFTMSNSPQFLDALNYMQRKGAQFILHGYTHQYDSTPNPFTGVSADDYEFFRVTIDEHTNIVTYTPVPEDSANWARARLEAALREFQLAHLNAVAWETPHYAASATDYSVFASTFPLTMQRVLYFDSAGHSAGQFFPYTIET